MRWSPPIDSASPVTTHVDKSGRRTATPVAIAGPGRGWSACPGTSAPRGPVRRARSKPLF